MSRFQVGSVQTKELVDPTPLPADIPEVKEIGVTSAPLKSAAFFIGSQCREFNEDFMLCKDENRDPAHCLTEGRRVTRCAQDLLSKMQKHCLESFTAHYECLERNNHAYYQCRKPERKLNACVFEKLGLTKTIPGGGPQGQQVHELKNPIYVPMQK